MGKCLLEMKNISKTFPGVKALDDVSIQIKHGKVVALLGANGAGKSTLMKILSGAYSCDSGEIYINGKKLPKEYKPIEARKHGIAIIYQELSLMKELTVAENIYLTHEPLLSKSLKLIDYKKMYKLAEEQLAKLHADYINVKAKVKELPLPEQQMVEIAKALAVDCKIIIMDEPTTSLTWDETKRLFDVIRALKQQDISVVYISHRMDEIFKISDSTIIMRDGKLVGEMDMNEITKEGIITMMTGRKVKKVEKKENKLNCSDKDVLLELREISDGKFIKNISLKLHKNEVLGIGGLVGSKRTELFKMVVGADKMTKGKIFVAGREVSINNPKEAISNGIGYLSENRKEEGLNLGLSIKENIITTDMKSVSNYSYLNQSKILNICNNYIEKIGIKGVANQNVINLSGGNQQKVAIAKWLHANCKIVIFDEPTRGIDIGAKAEIYQIIREFTSKGYGAIVISSEVAELAEVCDRVIVMSKGEITHEVTGENLNQDYILKCITSKEVV